MSNTLEFQRDHWRQAILDYDWRDPKLSGYDWGDPADTAARQRDGRILGNYAKIKDEYLMPEISGEKTVLEIGSYGGKWTQYMLKAGHIICVDLFDESFAYIKSHLPFGNIRFYKTSGNELSGIEERSVDLIFSMDTFVRIPKNFIFDYFREFARVLKPNGKICVHLPCRDIPGSVEREFTDLSGEEIRTACSRNGFGNFLIDDQTIRHGIILRVNY